MPKKKNGGNGKRNGSTTKPIKRQPRTNAIVNNDNIRPIWQKYDRLRGSDLISKITTVADPAVTDGASILAKLPITPSGYPGTRLTALSQLWERYRFTKFDVRFVTAMPMTVGCNLLIYLDTDPTDDPSHLNFNEAIRQATAQTGSQQWNFNRSKTVPFARRADDQLYYTGIDKQNARFTSAGNIFVMQVTTVNDINGAPVATPLVAGNLYIDWEVDLQIPQINPASISPVGHFSLPSTLLTFPFATGPQTAAFSKTISPLVRAGATVVGTLIKDGAVLSSAVNQNWTTRDESVLVGEPVSLINAGGNDATPSTVNNGQIFGKLVLNKVTGFLELLWQSAGSGSLTTAGSSTLGIAWTLLNGGF